MSRIDYRKYSMTGKNMQWLRKVLYFTVSHLAAELDISLYTLHSIEKSTKEVPEKIKIFLLKELNRSYGIGLYEQYLWKNLDEQNS